MVLKTHPWKNISRSLRLLWKNYWMIGLVLFFSERVCGKESQREQDYLQFDHHVRILLRADRENHRIPLDDVSLRHVFQSYKKIRDMVSTFHISFVDIRYLQAFALKAEVEESYLFDLLDIYRLDIQKGEESLLLKTGWNEKKLERSGITLGIRFIQFLNMVIQNFGEYQKIFVQNLVKERVYDHLEGISHPKMGKLLMMEHGEYMKIIDSVHLLIEKSQTRKTFSPENLSRLEDIIIGNHERDPHHKKSEHHR